VIGPVAAIQQMKLGPREVKDTNYRRGKHKRHSKSGINGHVDIDENLKGPHTRIGKTGSQRW